jgi:hypothetical protein
MPISPVEHREAAVERILTMQASSLPSDSASSIVAQFRAELTKPSRASERATHAVRQRATSGRKRLVDPTTCERDYTAADLEFMRAIEEYKQRSGRLFPTWSEVLEVVRSLGYQKQA